MYHIYVKIPGRNDYIISKKGHMFFIIDNTGFARRVDNKKICYDFSMGYKYKGSAIKITKISDECTVPNLVGKQQTILVDDMELSLILAERKLRG